MSSIPLNVLIIENQPLMRAALCAAIAGESGLTITAVAAEATDLLALADNLPADVIVYALEDPDGGDLPRIQTLRHLFPSASILALTNGEADGQKQAALAAGARAALEKTAPRAALLQALRALRLRLVASRQA